MSFYSWDDSLSVNVDMIDKQHKQLISFINNLYDAMTAGKGKDVLGKTLTDLVEYTKMHFSLEEKYMNEFKYPGEQLHILEHKKLTQQVIKLNNEFDEGKMVLSIEVMNFLKDWLNNHIKQNDKKFGEFLNKAGKR